MKRKIVQESLIVEKQKYPKSQWKKDATHLYMFTEYLKNGEKYNSDYYTLEDAKIMKSILRNKGSAFQFWIANIEDNYLDEVNI